MSQRGYHTRPEIERPVEFPELGAGPRGRNRVSTTNRMSSPAKILHIFRQMNRAGAELRTLDIMRNIDRERYCLQFCVLSGLPGDLDTEIRQLGGDVLPCRLGVGFPLRFRRLLQGSGFGAVHSHVHYFSGLILRLAQDSGVPVRIAHFRNTSDGHPTTLRRKIQRRLMRRLIDNHATDIIACGNAVMEAAWRRDWRSDARCRVIPNGLDLTAFSTEPEATSIRREFGLPDDARICIHVGRIEPQKNHGKIASVFCRLAQREPRAHLLLVGRGEPEANARLRQAFLHGGVLDRVVFTGVRSDVPRLLMAADIMLFPSAWEGLPGAVLEAMAAGTPVLGSDIPPIREIARSFDAVSTLSLSESDDEWATRAHEIICSSSTSANRSRARDYFSQTPYGILACVAEHVAVWERAATACP